MLFRILHLFVCLLQSSHTTISSTGGMAPFITVQCPTQMSLTHPSTPLKPYPHFSRNAAWRYQNSDKTRLLTRTGPSEEGALLNTWESRASHKRGTCQNAHSMTLGTILLHLNEFWEQWNTRACRVQARCLKGNVLTTKINHIANKGSKVHAMYCTHPPWWGWSWWSQIQKYIW